MSTVAFVQFKGGHYAFDSMAEVATTVERWVGGLSGVERLSPTRTRVHGPNGEATIIAM